MRGAGEQLTQIVVSHHGAIVLLNFVRAVAEDEDTGSNRDTNLLRGKLHTVARADDRSLPRQHGGGSVRKHHDGRRMPPGGEAHAARRGIVNAGPCGEEHLAVLFHRKRGVQSGEHLTGIGEIDPGERLGANDIEHTDGKQRRAHAVPANVKKADAEAPVTLWAVTEGIASERGRRKKLPRSGDRPVFDRRGQHALHIGRRLGEFGCELFLALLQRSERGLLGIAQALAVEGRTDPRPEEHRIERLGQIILRPLLDAGHHAFDLVERGNHDDRHVPQFFVSLDPPQHFTAVDPRHHDVEQNEIKILHLQTLQRRRPVKHRRACMTLLLQPPLQHRAVFFLVINNENFRGDGCLSDDLVSR